MTVCGLLVLAGLLAIVLWGGLELEAPAPEDDADEGRSPKVVARRYVWYVTVAVVAGVGSGLLIAGAGGRLAMRLLAASAGDAAQGRLTEADQVVGEITVDGTIGFIVFTGLFFGLASGVLYLLIRRWLPRGRLGGLAYGGLLLVVAASRIDPLRAENPDFDIVGPGWLSVLVFSSLVLAHGMSVATIAARYSRALPLLSRSGRSLAAHAPLLLLGPMAPVLVPVTVAGIVTVLAVRTRGAVDGLRSQSVTTAGRVILVVVVLVALPGFLFGVADIVNSNI